MLPPPRVTTMQSGRKRGQSPFAGARGASHKWTVPFPQPDGLDGGGDFGGGPFALHADGHDQHVGPAPTPAENLKEVADGRPGRAGHDGDPPHKGGQRPFAGRIEEPLPRQLFPQLPQGQFQSPHAARDNVLDDQLVAATCGINVEMPPADHLKAVVQVETRPHRHAAPHDRPELRTVVLERQIAVARLRPGEIRNFAGDPNRRKCPFEQILDLRGQFPDGKRTLGRMGKALWLVGSAKPQAAWPSQSSINNHQSTIINQQSSINIHHSTIIHPSPSAAAAFETALPDLADAAGRPGFGLLGQTVQQSLRLLAMMLQSVAIQVGRNEHLAADNGPGTRAGARHGELVPGPAHPPRAIVSEAHRHQRQAEFRCQKYAAGGQLPPRAARPVRRDRQVHLAALGQQLRGSRRRRRDSSSHERTRNPNGAPRRRASRRRGGGSAALPGCNVLEDTAGRGCIRAKKCRFSVRDIRETPGRSPDRRTRPCSRACSSTTARRPSPTVRRACSEKRFRSSWSRSGQSAVRSRKRPSINNQQSSINNLQSPFHSPENTSTASPIM